MMWLLWCLFLPGGSVLGGSVERPELEVKGLGRLRGVYQKTLGGREIAAFLGVPYAKTPTRFQPAEEVSAWSGLLDASQVKEDCLQYSELTLQIYGSEDCLHANIYTPKNFNSNSSYNVIIYIHGGGFSNMFGHYGPRYILDHDVVYVFFKYRLGPLGFLSTGDSVLPGNLGLKDQNRLLRWVSQYIKYFGGNPDRVLLTGTSAGGASVHYHLLSPLSKGLFHRAFSMSGSALCCWTQTEKSREKAELVAKTMGCPVGSSQEIVDCLSKKEGRDIVAQMKNLQKWLYYPFTPFGPVVEPDSPTAFISKYPSEIIRDGEAMDIPWLASLTSEEGLYPVADFVANETYLQKLEENWNDWVPSLLDYEYTTTIISKDKVSQKIREKYIGKAVVKDNIPGLIDMCSDRLFKGGVVRAAKLQAAHNKSPVYSYYFTYRGTHSGSEVVSGSKNNYGVSHGDDTSYIFQNEIMNAEESENDRKMIEVLTNMVVHFAETGKPSLKGLKKWPEVCAEDDFTYVHIKDPDNYEIASNPKIGQLNFWGSLKFSEDEFLFHSDTLSK